ncbi:MAG: Npt1/Npt2 family nucleotide transporter [Waddliaceae bacterium]
MSDTPSDSTNFTGFRALFWPIHRHELKKLIPMLLIFFFITLGYNILRMLKDTLVVTAKDSGAEVIPFIKVWLMFPGSIFLAFIYTRLNNHLSRERVITLMFSMFLLFFFLFTFILFPHRESLRLDHLADSMASVLPAGCKGLVAMVRHWIFSGFYVMSELWGNIVLFVLFWGFANQVTKVGESKRFYALFGFGGNISGIIGGWVSISVSRIPFLPWIPYGTNAWEQTLMILVSITLVGGLCALLLFKWLIRNVVSTSEAESTSPTNEKKERHSMRKNMRHLLSSKYLIFMGIIVLAYNLAINLVEVLWKHEMHALFPNPTEYHTYFSEVSTIIGVVATLSSLLISGQSIRRFGWTFTALATPIIVFVTSAAFFFLFFTKDSHSAFYYSLFGVSPLALVVWVGSFQNIACRAAKYTVYDATKEMAFVPLDKKTIVKGKAAIDGVINRMGKSSGSFIHQSLLFFFSSLSASAPWVAAILFTVVGCWFWATKKLGKEFNELTQSTTTPVPSYSTKTEAQPA